MSGSRWLRIPVRIQPIFWLMAFFIGWINSSTFYGGPLLGTMLWAGIIVISLLVHEYGHALTAVACGQRATIELMLFGGVTRHQGGKLSRWQELLIIINGPLAGLLLAGAAYFLLATKGPLFSKTIIYVLTVTWSINLFWTFVNLLPIHPLDGGQLLGIILQMFFGHRGYSAALLISTFFGATVALLFFAGHALLAGSLFLMLAFESYRSWRYSTEMSDVDHEVSYQQQLKRAESLLENRDFTAAQPLLLQLSTITANGVIHDSALGYLAEIYLSQGRYQAAYQLLQPSNGTTVSGQLLPLLVRAAYACGDWQTAVDNGDAAYRKSPSATLALVNARSHARLGHAIPTVGWLHCALREGAENMATTLKHPDFDNVRTDESFRGFAAK